MASPDPERALEDETPAEPGARAGEPRGGADALARDVAREAGGVADQREALAADPPRPAAADRVGVPAKGREGEVVGQPPAGGEPRQQALEPPADGLAAQ